MWIAAAIHTYRWLKTSVDTFVLQFTAYGNENVSRYLGAWRVKPSPDENKLKVIKWGLTFWGWVSCQTESACVCPPDRATRRWRHYCFSPWCSRASPSRLPCHRWPRRHPSDLTSISRRRDLLARRRRGLRLHRGPLDTSPLTPEF